MAIQKSTNTGLKPPSELQIKTRLRNMSYLRGVIPGYNCLLRINKDLLTIEELDQLHQAQNYLRLLMDNWKVNNFEFGIRPKIEYNGKYDYEKIVKFIGSKEFYQ